MPVYLHFMYFTIQSIYCSNAFLREKKKPAKIANKEEKKKEQGRPEILQYFGGGQNFIPYRSTYH